MENTTLTVSDRVYVKYEVHCSPFTSTMEPHAQRLCIGDASLDLDIDLKKQGNRFMCVFKRACMSVSSGVPLELLSAGVLQWKGIQRW